MERVQNDAGAEALPQALEIRSCVASTIRFRNDMIDIEIDVVDTRPHDTAILAYVPVVISHGPCACFPIRRILFGRVIVVGYPFRHDEFNGAV